MTIEQQDAVQAGKLDYRDYRDNPSEGVWVKL
jgi:hypothetical protein